MNRLRLCVDACRLVGGLGCLAILVAGGPVRAESLSQTKAAVTEAFKDGVTAQEFETLKPRLIAQINFKENLGQSLKALTLMYELGRCIPGEISGKIEEEVVRRFIDAKLDADKLGDADWKNVAEFIRSVKAIGEGEREHIAFHRPLGYLDRIRASSLSPKIGAVALFAKTQAALVIDRIVNESPLESKDRDAILKEIKNAPKEYAPIVVDGKATFASLIPGMRFELENLHEGRAVPETEGIDLDGNPMKLSEYRGKTVLLVGWADWCPDCLKAIPGEKELMQKFAGKPVAFVGINGDDKRETAQSSAAKHGVPGKSFWGRWPGADGKQTIAVDQWNIRFWPSYYVIDPKGVIRFKRCWDTEPSQLEEVINTVLAASK